MTMSEVDLLDLSKIRKDQATLLRDRVRQSCLIVKGVIIYFTIMLAWTGEREFAVVWLAATTGMVIVTWLYAVLRAPHGITEENFRGYLHGHIVVSCATGLVWSTLAILYLDTSSAFNMFIACNIAVAITLGGLLPSAEYRPSFLGLSTCLIVPFSIYWLVVVEGPEKMVGLGLLIYYLFALMMSARAEINTREGIAARNSNEMTARLVEQNDIIRAANLEKTRFLAATSHDLSQPLHAQGFFIQAMRKTLQTDEQHNLLDRIEKTWRSQNRLLRGLLDISRLDSGVISPKMSDFSLDRELADQIGEFADRCRKKNIELVTELHPVEVSSDATLLMRIVGNLVSNAVKFTPPNGRIDITSTVNGEHACVIIKDTGPGIPVEQQERVFEEYVRLTDNGRDRTQGLGLGLSIVKRLADLLEIPVDLESEEGAGTRWAVRVPVAQSGKVRSPRSVTSPDGFDQAPLIIVIDDEEDIRQAMSLLLTDWGCKTLCVGGLEEALVLLERIDIVPDLVIADKRLENGQSGIDAIYSLREETNEEIPAILMTGDIQGFDDVRKEKTIQLMAKPVNPAEIKQMIRATQSA